MMLYLLILLSPIKMKFRMHKNRPTDRAKEEEKNTAAVAALNGENTLCVGARVCCVCFVWERNEKRNETIFSVRFAMSP